MWPANFVLPRKEEERKRSSAAREIAAAGVGAARVLTREREKKGPDERGQLLSERGRDEWEGYG